MTAAAPEHLLDERFAAFRAACARDGAAGDYAAYACAGADALQAAWARTLAARSLAWAQHALVAGGCACRVLAAGRCLWLWHGRALPAVQHAEHAVRECGEGGEGASAARTLVAAFRVVCHALLCPDVAAACARAGDETEARRRRREMEGLASAVAQVGTAFGFIKVESVLMVDELTHVWHAAGLV